MLLNQMFDQFNGCYRIKAQDPRNTINLFNANKLIQDEVNEMKDECHENPDLANVAKEMADIIYITAQRMRGFGFDVDAILAEVHRSNMSKTVAHIDAQNELALARERYPEAYLDEAQQYIVIRDAATKKVIKPTCYSTAKITGDML